MSRFPYPLEHHPPAHRARVPKSKKGNKRRRAGLDAYWDHLTGDLATAYHELCVAGRTDPELKSILEKSSTRFELHVRDTNFELFEEWADRGDRFELAMDVTRFMMEGMARGQLTAGQSSRIPSLLNYLAYRLEEIFKEGDSSAAARHAAKK